MAAGTGLSEHARRQAEVWGTDPEGWAEFAEGHNEPLFVAVLDAAGVGRGTRLLDVGCGTGRALALARSRGAQAVGLDATVGLLDVAARRVPGVRLVPGELDALPFDGACFDAVTGINAFQFAADPQVALQEAARVLTVGGRVVASLFAEPERCESTAIHLAMSALVPPAVPSSHAPYLLSEPGRLESLLAAAGLEVLDDGEVECVWAYDDVAGAVRGLLASAGGARTVEVAGRAATADAVRSAVAPFTAADGSIRMHNTFRWTSAVKAAERSTP